MFKLFAERGHPAGREETKWEIKKWQCEGTAESDKPGSLVSMRFLREHSPMKLDAWAVKLSVAKDEDFLDLCVNVEQNVSIAPCLRDFSNTETLWRRQEYCRETGGSRGPAKDERQKAAHDFGLACRVVQVQGAAPRIPNDLTRWSSCWNCSSPTPAVMWCIWTACTFWLWWRSTGAVLLIMALCPFYCGEKSWLLAFVCWWRGRENGCPSYWRILWPDFRYKKKIQNLDIFYSVHQDNNLKDCGTHLNGGNCSKHSELQTFLCRHPSPPETHQQCTPCLRGLAVWLLPLPPAPLHFPTCTPTRGFKLVWGNVNCSQIVVRFRWMTFANFRIEITIAGRNINNLRYADDTALI